MAFLARILSSLLLVLALAAPAAGQAVPKAIQAKLDTTIVPPEEDEEQDPFQVFIRFEDQLFPTTKAFEEFCEKHHSDKRTALRTRVIAALKRKSDSSFKKVKKLLASLGGTLEADDDEEEEEEEEFEEEEEGEDLSESVDELKRYWLVNGVGCTATYQACLKLAAHKEVAFVYANPTPHRIPPVSNQSHLVAAKKYGRFYGGLRVRRDELMEQFTAMWDATREAEAEGFDPKGHIVPWNLQKIGADQVWTKEKVTGKGIVVGVLDTGCMPSPALVQSLWRNEKEKYDGEDTDGNGYVDDVFGYDFIFNNGVSIGELMLIKNHGSLCAGIVAGRPFKLDDGKTIVTGIAPESKVMILRGIGQLPAFEYGLMHGVDVMSMSFGFNNMKTGNWRGIYRLAFENLTAAGMVLVGAAGNSGPAAQVSRAPGSGPGAEGEQIGMPQGCPTVITVGGVEKDEKVSGASSRGPVMWNDVKFYADYPKAAPLQKPDVAAYFGGFPCWMYIVSGTSKRKNYKIIHHLQDAMGLVRGPQGTSFAGPHAAGVAALMLSANPELPAWRIKGLMIKTAKDLGDKGWDKDYGHGLLQALPAVQAAKKETR